MGKWCPKHVEALSFNNVKVNVKCIKLVHVIKLYHDALNITLKLENDLGELVKGPGSWETYTLNDVDVIYGMECVS
jgi:hypothetical protein